MMKRAVLAAVAVAAVALLVISLTSGGDEASAPVSNESTIKGRVVINFTGAPSPRPAVAQAFSVSPGQKAWEAVKQAIGESNIQYQDYGGDLGIFVTGFYGVAPGCPWWEFYVDGASATAGVSSYTVESDDVLEFRLSSC
jgi:hypothetical protein